MDIPDESGPDEPVAPAEYAPPVTTKARRFTIASFGCAVLAIVLYPIVFGPLGVIFAIYGKRNGDPLAQRALVVAIVAMVVGIILGALLAASSDDSALALAG